MNALSRQHFHSLATTGGLQPYSGLQECFRAEQIDPNFMIEPGFLDRAVFMASGSGFTHYGSVLRSIAWIGD